MGSSKRVQLSVLCLTVVALFVVTASVDAQNKTWNVKSNARLKPVGDEPRASGQAKVTGVLTAYDGWDGPYYVFDGSLSFSCKGLTPGATYMAGWGSEWGRYPFTAGADGSFSGGPFGTGNSRPTGMSVDRVSGTSLIPVLHGKLSG